MGLFSIQFRTCIQFVSAIIAFVPMGTVFGAYTMQGPMTKKQMACESGGRELKEDERAFSVILDATHLPPHPPYQGDTNTCHSHAVSYVYNSMDYKNVENLLNPASVLLNYCESCGLEKMDQPANPEVVLASLCRSGLKKIDGISVPELCKLGKNKRDEFWQNKLLSTVPSKNFAFEAWNLKKMIEGEQNLSDRYHQSDSILLKMKSLIENAKKTNIPLIMMYSNFTKMGPDESNHIVAITGIHSICCQDRLNGKISCSMFVQKVDSDIEDEISPQWFKVKNNGLFSNMEIYRVIPTGSLQLDDPVIENPSKNTIPYFLNLLTKYSEAEVFQLMQNFSKKDYEVNCDLNLGLGAKLLVQLNYCSCSQLLRNYDQERWEKLMSRFKDIDFIKNLKKSGCENEYIDSFFEKIKSILPKSDQKFSLDDWVKIANHFSEKMSLKLEDQTFMGADTLEFGLPGWLNAYGDQECDPAALFSRESMDHAFDFPVVSHDSRQLKDPMHECTLKKRRQDEALIESIDMVLGVFRGF